MLAASKGAEAPYDVDAEEMKMVKLLVGVELRVVNTKHRMTAPCQSFVPLRCRVFSVAPGMDWKACVGLCGELSGVDDFHQTKAAYQNGLFLSLFSQSLFESGHNRQAGLLRAYDTVHSSASMSRSSVTCLYTPRHPCKSGQKCCRCWCRYALRAPVFPTGTTVAAGSCPPP